MARRYWEEERPLELKSSKNVLRYFPQAQKLQVGYPAWIDRFGVERPGKVVTLDFEAFRTSPHGDRLAELLEAIVAQMRDKNQIQAKEEK